MPLSLPGALHPSNKFCIDWNSSGVIAYGSHNVIFIVDVASLKRIQAIEHHQSAIQNLCWAPDNIDRDLEKTVVHRIASSDIGGHIIVCDALTANKISEFNYSGTNVLAMSWYSWKSKQMDLIMALHSGNSLVLWNAHNGEKIWSHNYTQSLCKMALDPFNSKHITFGTNNNSLVVVRDVSYEKEPFSNGYLYNFSDVGNHSAIQFLSYHKAYKNLVFAVLNSQIYLFETDLCSTLVKIPLENNFVCLNSCSLRDAFYTVQTSGSIALRTGVYKANDDRANATFDYLKVCSSDTMRQGSQQKVVASALCPVTQSTIAVLYNSGKVLFWHLSTEGSSSKYMKSFIDDYVAFDENLNTTASEDLRLSQLGMLGSLSAGVGCVRMRPMDELGKTKDDDFASCEYGASHVAAVGTNAGYVHLVDVFTANIIREFNVQSSPIKSLEWGGAYTILTAGYNHVLSTTQIVRNDIYATDIKTGLSRRIRPEVDESPITLVRVSYYHCYLALAFQREPLEIWDLKNFRLLRKMSRTCPLITDMAWSSKHHGMKMTEQSGHNVYKENLVVLDSENRLYHVCVKGLHVKDGKEVNTQWKSGGWTIRSMAWKDDILAMGDADGRIAVWDLGRRQSRHVCASRLPVLRMCFSRLAGDHTLAVLHQRELALWDTEALTRIQQINVELSRAALDLDLCGISPLMITNDNVFRFYPSSQKNNSISDKDIPPLMNASKVSQIMSDFDANVSTTSTEWLLSKKVPRMSTLELDTSYIRNEAVLSRYLGDVFGFLLLQLVQHALEPEDHIQLAPCLQMFWPCSTFKERELRVTCVACTSADVMESRLVERAVVTGGKAKDRAVDRLIASSDLRHASMKAALLVSSQESEQAKSLIKLIATNLIASDMIEDGVELLFLVGSGVDACRYLQSQRQWNKSVAYAKMGLEDPSEIIAKWIAHLQNDDIMRYIFAQAARCEWPSVVESLSTIGRSRLARIILRTTTSSPNNTENASPEPVRANSS